MIADGIMNSLAVKTTGPLAEPADHPRPWLPGAALPAALVTGHPLVHAEHRQLLASMTSLRAICAELRTVESCAACSGSRQQCCENELIRLLGDLLAFILDHFKTEEGLMRDSLLLMLDRDVCEAHMEDHAAISCKIQQIVSRIDRVHAVGLLRDLDDLLGQWISNHIALHDMTLARWIAREGAVVSMARYTRA